MLEAKNWENLPTEILCIIFGEIQSSINWKEVRDALYQCQLVCKSWSTLAQRGLYTNVYLPDGRNAAFATTLKANPSLGYLVKNIEFYPDFITYGGAAESFAEVIQIVTEIEQHIPNIERIGSPNMPGFEWDFLWKYLSASKNQYEYLKDFALSDRWNASSQCLYTALALKFRKSLTKIRLLPYHASDDKSQEIDFCTLKNTLKEFTSLKQLHIRGLRKETSRITELDEILNDCHTSLHSLELDGFHLSDDHNYTRKIFRNNSIKKLKLGNLDLYASSILYFANRMPALETLELTTEAPNCGALPSKADYAEWWNQMMRFCQPLQNYNISIDEINPQDYLHQITGCARMSSTIAGARILQEESAMEFTMCVNDPKKYIIEMKQNGSCVRLFESDDHDIFMEVVDFDQIFKCVQPFLPHIIRILKVQDPEDVMSLCLNYDLDDLSDEDLNSSSIQGFNIRNRAILKGATSSVKETAGSVVHLDTMIFLGTSPDIQQVSEQLEPKRISEFKFTNSMFHPNAFPDLSLKLPKIGTLVLENCNLILRSPYELEINLSATQLDCLVLKSNSFVYLGSSVHPEKCQTIVVTTDNWKKTTYNYTEDKDCRTYQEILDTAGSEENFLISIKCKELQRWNFSDNTEWKQLIFEELN